MPPTFPQRIEKFRQQKKKNHAQFMQLVWDFYHANRRPFIWRDKITPYTIFISEVMLQQTQTDRVLPKFINFIEHFPSFESLAQAPFVDVLAQWKGLGYNRRAKYLQTAAQIITQEHNGTLPKDPEVLVELPGIGPATAASVSTFAYNLPNIFIETNIRSVFLYLYYPEQENIHDKEILKLVEETLDLNKPRDWYYALMDLGVFIKKTYGNPNKKSKHYTKQKSFKGSDRQIRGKILEYLLAHTEASTQELYTFLDDFENERIDRILVDLVNEKLVTQKALNVFTIKD
jgi:A/G-specific adenine glycosylase